MTDLSDHDPTLAAEIGDFLFAERTRFQSDGCRAATCLDVFLDAVRKRWPAVTWPDLYVAVDRYVALRDAAKATREATNG